MEFPGVISASAQKCVSGHWWGTAHGWLGSETVPVWWSLAAGVGQIHLVVLSLMEDDAFWGCIKIPETEGLRRTEVDPSGL